MHTSFISIKDLLPFYSPLMKKDNLAWGKTKQSQQFHTVVICMCVRACVYFCIHISHLMASGQLRMWRIPGWGVLEICLLIGRYFSPWHVSTVCSEEPLPSTAKLKQKAGLDPPVHDKPRGNRLCGCRVWATEPVIRNCIFFSSFKWRKPLKGQKSKGQTPWHVAGVLQVWRAGVS